MADYLLAPERTTYEGPLRPELAQARARRTFAARDHVSPSDLLLPRVEEGDRVELDLLVRVASGVD